MIDYFHTLQKKFYGNPTLLKRALEQTDYDAKKACKNLKLKVEKTDLGLMTITDKKYSEALREIAIPPIAFYYKGSLKCLDKPVIGIVGTRKISQYGRKTVSKIVEELARYDITIASGLAYGIDAHAHRESLKKGLNNVAVLASGLDQIYPSPHKKLAQEIIQKDGAIISEMPPGVPSQRFMFPIRNRIIAGLAQAVIVIEAPQRSGALITANHAFSENRLVYAVPGEITEYRNEGCHNLIKNQKAVLLTSAQQIIEDLALTAPNLRLRTDNLTPKQEKILATLRKRPLHISRIAEKTKFSQSALATSLLELEVSGRIRNAGAMHYVKL